MLSRLSLAICIIFVLTSTAFARSGPPEASQARGFPAPPVYASAAVVMDADTGAVLDAINPHAHRAIASTTKIMTALLALKVGKLSDRITVPAAAFNFESDATVMGLHVGEVVTLKDLLYGLMLPSGADAANTIAIHYGGSESRFVSLMNRQAAALGMRDTHYATAHGLDAPNQYSSAYDLAILARYVSELPALMKVASTRSYTWNGHVLTNINHVLFWYPGIDGIKPGYTDAAGICQVLDVRRDGRHVVVVALNTPNLVTDARNLLNFGLRDFTWVQSPLPGDSPYLTTSGHDARGSYVYFPAAGHYLRGAFWTGFLANGGFTALGFPRTEPLTEGRKQVQYFENGALARDSSGHLTRLALGLTPIPSPTVVPTSTATRTPSEGTIGTPDTAQATPKPTRTPKPAPTATPTARPSSGPPTTGKVFVPFQRSHKAMLGTAAYAATKVGSYTFQVFRYGALLYDPKARRVWRLPLGDRQLLVRQFLADHPGNTYPSGFAPTSILKAIGWLPSNTNGGAKW